MKNYYFIGVFFFTLSLLSCGENSLIYSPIKVDDNVDAAPITGLFQKQVLIEDYTGTWCGNCARVAYAIERTKEASDRVVSVAIHHGNDPYDFDGIGPLKNLIEVKDSL
jgi:hypothetical protein